MNLRVICFCLLVFSVAGMADEKRSAVMLEQGFDAPSREARPRVWWGWVNGLVSKDGITKDLEALKAAGFDGACLFDTHQDNWSGFPKGSVLPLSAEWQDMFNFAASEAARLDLRLSMQNCPGWSFAGGPWVSPEDALKQITTSVRAVQGGAEFDGVLDVPVLENGFYRDVAVLAVPVSSKTKRSDVAAQLKSVTSYDGREIPAVTDGLPGTSEIFQYHLYRTGKLKELYLTLAFNQPYCAEKLYLLGYDDTAPKQLELWAGNSEEQLQKVGEFSVNRNGRGAVFEFPQTTARIYRVQFKDSYHRWRMSVAEIELLRKDQVPRGFCPVPYWDVQTAKSGITPAVSKIINRSLPDDFSEGDVSVDSIIDLTDQVDSSGRLRWNVPAGEWEIYRIGCTLVVHHNHPTVPEACGLECDKMDAGAVRRHLDAYAGKYIRALSPEARKSFHFLHVDSMEQRISNWTLDMPKKFEQLNGYDLRPWLLVFCGKAVESSEQTSRFLWDYRRTMADLLATEFYGELTGFCHELGLQSSAEACGPHPEVYPPYDPLRVKGQVDIPMGENWLTTTEGRLPDRIGSLCDTREAASAAHIYNKPVAQTETFTAYRATFAVDPLMTKPLGDLLFCEGINRFALHKFTHHPDDAVPGLPYHRFGTSFNRHQSWWSGAKAWTDYLTRCQSLLQQGLHRADLLYYYGEDVTTLASFSMVPEQLRPPAGYDFDWLNAEVLLRDLTADDDGLKLPHGSRYKVLILPDCEKMRPQVLEKIYDLINAGATVIGAPPKCSPSLVGFPQCDKQVTRRVEKIWGNASGENRVGKGRIVWNCLLQDVLDRIDCPPDFSFQCLEKNVPMFGTYPPDGRVARIRYVHRCVDGVDFYFLSNQSKKPAQFRAAFRAVGAPELWNPMDGSKQSLNGLEQTDQATAVDMQLPEYGSAFVVFNPKRTAGVPPALVVQKSLQLTGAWQVEFTPAYGPAFRTEFPELVSWPQHLREDIRYFSGTAIYRKLFDFPGSDGAGRIVLNLGGVETIAQVAVNGQDVATLWAPPYETDITDVLKPGENQLTVRVSNLWVNRLIGDAGKNENERCTSTPFQLPASPIRYKPDDPLLPSGLIGPVRLQFLTQ